MKQLLAILVALAPIAARGTAQGFGPPSGGEPAKPAPAAAAAAAPATVRLSGKVVTWDGRPVAGAAIACTIARTSDTNELLKEARATTDADGKYALTVDAPKPKEPESRVLHVAAKGMAAVVRNIPWKRKATSAATGPDLAIVGGDGVAVVLEDVTEGDLGAGDASEAQAPTEKPVEYEAETAIDDIVLTAGQRLFGRVRDENGKPLAGVRVVATDLLEAGNSFRSGTRFGFHCAAVSEASGIFSLPCALPLASRLEFRSEGCFTEVLQPVAAGTPLEMTMKPSGWIQGRVLDKDGRSIAEASVTVSYELRATTRPIRTGADGSFRVGLERPGRWRIRASKKVGETMVEANSDVMSGPRENFEVIVESKADAAAAEKQTLTVRAVAKKDGQAIKMFTAVAVWEQYANQNNAYLDYLLRHQVRAAPKTKTGTATVNGPGKHGTSTGAIRVVAAGYAPATKKEVEWKEPEANQTPEPITLELDPEATIAGTLRDERSGQPVAGAKVYVRPRVDPNQGRYDDGDPSDAPVSAADGSFKIAGLGEGQWEIVVRDPKRPSAPATEVELAAAEQKTGISITLPSGAEVAGALEGTAIGHGTRVFLSKLPRQTFGESNHYYSHWGGNQQPGQTGVLVAPDGTFRIEGVALENHLLVLRLPSPPRLGGDLFLPLEPFRVRTGGVQRKFDCSEDQPGRIQGRITFADAAVPFEHIVVVAGLVPEEDGQIFFSPYDTNHAGRRSFVGADGAFDLHVGPGTYQLRAVDLDTGVVLHMEEKKLKVATAASVERDMKLELAKIELVLKPAADVKEMALVERIELRMVPKALKAMAANFGNNDQYDSGGGLWWPLGESKRQVVLPLGTATFLCRNVISNLRIDEERWNNMPLGRAEFEVATGPGAKTTCEIEVGAPPEVPDPKKDKKEAEGQDDPETGDPAVIKEE